MEKVLNGITFTDGANHEEREIIISGALECKEGNRNGKKVKFATLTCRGDYLIASGCIDNQELLEPATYYDLRFVKASGIALPVDPSLDGIYTIEFTGRAWLDTREPEDNEDAALVGLKRPVIFLKGHDVKFAKKGNLAKKKA